MRLFSKSLTLRRNLSNTVNEFLKNGKSLTADAVVDFLCGLRQQKLVINRDGAFALASLPHIESELVSSALLQFLQESKFPDSTVSVIAEIGRRRKLGAVSVDDATMSALALQNTDPNALIPVTRESAFVCVSSRTPPSPMASALIPIIALGASPEPATRCIATIVKAAATALSESGCTSPETLAAAIVVLAGVVGVTPTLPSNPSLQSLCVTITRADSSAAAYTDTLWAQLADAPRTAAYYYTPLLTVVSTLVAYDDPRPAVLSFDFAAQHAPAISFVKQFADTSADASPGARAPPPTLTLSSAFLVVEVCRLAAAIAAAPAKAFDSAYGAAGARFGSALVVPAPHAGAFSGTAPPAGVVVDVSVVSPPRPALAAAAIGAAIAHVRALYAAQTRPGAPIAPLRTVVPLASAVGNLVNTIVRDTSITAECGAVPTAVHVAMLCDMAIPALEVVGTALTHAVECGAAIAPVDVAQYIWLAGVVARAAAATMADPDAAPRALAEAIGAAHKADSAADVAHFSPAGHALPGRGDRPTLFGSALRQTPLAAAVSAAAQRDADAAAAHVLAALARVAAEVAGAAATASAALRCVLCDHSATQGAAQRPPRRQPGVPPPPPPPPIDQTTAPNMPTFSKELHPQHPLMISGGAADVARLVSIASAWARSVLPAIRQHIPDFTAHTEVSSYASVDRDVDFLMQGVCTMLPHLHGRLQVKHLAQCIRAVAVIGPHAHAYALPMIEALRELLRVMDDPATSVTAAQLSALTLAMRSLARCGFVASDAFARAGGCLVRGLRSGTSVSDGELMWACEAVLASLAMGSSTQPPRWVHALVVSIARALLAPSPKDPDGPARAATCSLHLGWLALRALLFPAVVVSDPEKILAMTAALARAVVINAAAALRREASLVAARGTSDSRPAAGDGLIQKSYSTFSVDVAKALAHAGAWHHNKADAQIAMAVLRLVTHSLREPPVETAAALLSSRSAVVTLLGARPVTDAFVVDALGVYSRSGGRGWAWEATSMARMALGDGGCDAGASTQRPIADAADLVDLAASPSSHVVRAVMRTLADAPLADLTPYHVCVGAALMARAGVCPPLPLVARIAAAASALGESSYVLAGHAAAAMVTYGAVPCEVLGAAASLRGGMVVAAANGIKAVALQSGYEIFTNVRSAYLAPDVAPGAIGSPRSSELLRLRHTQLPDVLLVGDGESIIIQWVTDDAAFDAADALGDDPAASVIVSDDDAVAITGAFGDTDALISSSLRSVSTGTSSAGWTPPALYASFVTVTGALRHADAGGWMGRPVYPDGPEFVPAATPGDVIPFVLHHPAHDAQLVAAFTDTLVSAGDGEATTAVRQVLLRVGPNGRIADASVHEYKNLVLELAQSLLSSEASPEMFADAAVSMIQRAAAAAVIGGGRMPHASAV